MIQNSQRQSNWSITISPTKTGMRVRTNADVNDVLADHVSRYVERCLSDWSETL